jgi:hypothetical protein
MTNNDLLPGWAMPEDLAKQVNEVLNRKSITPKDELADALDEMARDIALIEPDPEDWGGWVIYLLEQMEMEVKKRGRQAEFEEMQKYLKNNIGN